MNKKKYYLIYQVTNNVNGKIYIGMHETNDLEDDYMGSGKILNKAKEKYGLENFTFKVLMYLQNREEMRLLEHCVVTPEFCAREDVYNIKEGGDGGWDYINSTGKNMSGNWKSATQYRREKIKVLGYNPYTGENATTFGKTAYYSKELNQVRYFLSSNVIPDGYVLGNPKQRGSGTKDTHWYYNKQTLEAMCLTDEEYELVDKNIWIKGQSPNRKQFIRYNPTKNTKCMYNETLRQTKHVKQNEIEMYLNNGWKFGAVYNWDRFFIQKELDAQKLPKRFHQIDEIQLYKQNKIEEIVQKRKDKAEKLRHKIQLLNEMYEFYAKYGFKALVEKYNYKYSRANFIQQCQKYVKSFIPQNRKKRKQ